jgi:hypothetical protein
VSPWKKVARPPANLVAVDCQTPGPPVRRRCSGRRRREDQYPDADVAQRLVTEHSRRVFIVTVCLRRKYDPLVFGVCSLPRRNPLLRGRGRRKGRKWHHPGFCALADRLPNQPCPQ